MEQGQLRAADGEVRIEPSRRGLAALSISNHDQTVEMTPMQMRQLGRLLTKKANELEYDDDQGF